MRFDFYRNLLFFTPMHKACKDAGFLHCPLRMPGPATIAAACNPGSVIREKCILQQRAV
jgi:hypothetical protein